MEEGEEGEKYSTYSEAQQQKKAQKDKLKELVRQRIKAKSFNRDSAAEDDAYENEYYEDEDERDPGEARSKKASTNGNGRSGQASTSGRSPLPLTEFGSFFGPSQRIVAPRVLQAQEAARVAARDASQKMKQEQVNAARAKASANKSASAGFPKQQEAYQRAQKPVDEKVLKVRELKASRNYSFLDGDDDAPPPPRPKPDANGTGREGGATNGGRRKPDDAPANNKRPPVKQAPSNRPSAELRRNLPPGSAQKDQLPARPSETGRNFSNRDRPASSMKPPPSGSKQNPGSSSLPRPTDRPNDRSMDRFGDRSVDRFGDRSVDRTGNRPVGSKGQNHPSQNTARASPYKINPAANGSSGGGVSGGSKGRPDIARSLVSEGGVNASREKPAGRTGGDRGVANAGPMERRQVAAAQKPVKKRPSDQVRRPNSAPKQAPSNRPPLPKRENPQRPPPRRPPGGYESDEAGSLDSFIDDDDGDFRGGLSSVLGMFRRQHKENHRGGYRDDSDDDMMEASFDEIHREEQRSLKIAREEDARELALEEERERRRLEKLKRKR